MPYASIPPTPFCSLTAMEKCADGSWWLTLFPSCPTVAHILPFLPHCGSHDLPHCGSGLHTRTSLPTPGAGPHEPLNCTGGVLWFRELLRDLGLRQAPPAAACAGGGVAVRWGSGGPLCVARRRHMGAAFKWLAGAQAGGAAAL